MYKQRSAEATVSFKLPLIKPGGVERQSDAQTEIIFLNQIVVRGRHVLVLGRNIDGRTIVVSVGDRNAYAEAGQIVFRSVLIVHLEVRSSIRYTETVVDMVTHAITLWVRGVLSANGHFVAV